MLKHPYHSCYRGPCLFYLELYIPFLFDFFVPFLFGLLCLLFFWDFYFLLLLLYWFELFSYSFYFLIPFIFYRDLILIIFFIIQVNMLKQAHNQTLKLKIPVMNRDATSPKNLRGASSNMAGKICPLKKSLPYNYYLI